MRNLLGLTLLLFLLATSASADDGNKRLGECSTALRMVGGGQLDLSQINDAASCIGFVYGFASGYQAGQSISGGKADYCPPASVSTTAQLIRIFVKYLNDHPAELRRTDSVLLRQALVEAYPCRTP